jgi:predicted transcriptional regulator
LLGSLTKNSRLEEQSVDIEEKVSQALALRQNILGIFDSLGIKDLEQDSQILATGEVIEDSSLTVGSLIDFFNKKGWGAKPNRTLRGRSGADHSFSIVCELPQITMESSEGREFVGIDIVRSHKQVEGVAVLALFAKSLDCDIRSRIMIAVPKLSEQARILAKSYNMQFVEAENLNLAAILMQGTLDFLIERKKELISRGKTRKSYSSKRNAIDIMADILTVLVYSSSKSEIMSRANLSYEQCQKYLPVLGRLELISKSIEDGVHVKFSITEKGREYLDQLSDQFGRISKGEKSVWGAGGAFNREGLNRNR